MIYTINNCIRAFGYTNFDKLIADMGSVDNLKAYVIANGYADIAVAEDTELLLVDVNGKTWHTGCYGAKLGPEVEQDYLCFTSTGDSTVAMTQNGTPNTSANKVIQYKLNDGQWQTWDLSAVSLVDGDKMYLKSDDDIPISETSSIYKQFTMTGSIAASGNIMSLLNFIDTLTTRAFCRLFYNCSSLTAAPALPATTLADFCYFGMFQACTSLTTVPTILPATTLAQGCYRNMFYYCSSLTAAPVLPATTLDTSCYQFMFKMCTSLVNTPELPATTLTISCYNGMFNGCTSLVNTPELPATTLTISCYSSMFESCTSLTTAPALPATTLARSCYEYMFKGCTSLTTAPALPATTLANNCYNGMFFGCTSLVTAPDLPATNLADSCYNGMFYECTSLTTAPELPATTLADACYYGMFNTCMSLTQAPELPATTLTPNCYCAMFYTCISLTQAPELPATTLTENCYYNMFNNCSELNYVKAMFTDISAQDCLTGWLGNVSETGTFIKSKDATWTNEQAGIPTGWTVQVEGGVTPEPEPERDYLCFTSTGDSTVAMTQNGTPNTSANKVIQYKLNNGQWQTLDLSAVTLADGDKMYLKSDDIVPLTFESTNTADNYEITFNITGGSVVLSGDITSLYNFDNTVNIDNKYKKLFRNCASITDASNLKLPDTILLNTCYKQMFANCTSLTQAPALPATTLAKGCYSNMFFNCTSLTQAPELPATTLAENCYAQMFYGCSKLNYVKALFIEASYLDSNHGNWLGNVSPTGTFIKSKDATWTNEQAGIPTGWTVQVEGGVTPEPGPERDYLCFTSTGDSTVAMTQNGTPTDISKNKVLQYKLNNGQWQTWDLSAVTLHDGDKMYLKSDDEIPFGEQNYVSKNFVMTGSIAASGNIMSLLNFSTSLTHYVFYKLFKNCASLTQAPELPATTLSSNCYEQMFFECTALTVAPALPATTLQFGCYMNMFSGCQSLTTAPALPATTLYNYCYSAMFNDCQSLTTAPELPATTLPSGCYYYMFNGCTKLNYIKAMFTDMQSDSLYGWLTGVSPTGTFVKNSAATWTNEQAEIPTGWTVQTTSPDK